MKNRPSYEELEQRVLELEQAASECHRASDELQKSEQRFKALHDASFGGVIIHDHGVILECNQGLSDITGFTNEALVGMNGLDLIAPDSLDLVLKNIKSGYEQRYDVEGVRKDGSIYPLSIKGKNVDYMGRDVRVIEFSDITERRQIEKNLTESEVRFANMFQEAPLGYQSLDSDGNLVEVNPAWLAILGFTREEVVGRWFGEFLAPEFVERFRERFPLFKAKGTIHSEFVMITKSGARKNIAIEGRIGRNNDGSFNATHCMLTDITERERAEAKIAKTQLLLAEAQAVAKLGGFELDVKTLSQTWTEETFRILEVDVEGDEPKVPEGVNFIAPEYREAAQKAISHATEEGESYDQTWEVITAKGNRKWVRSTGKPNFKDEKVESISGSIQDITESKQLEADLRYAYDYLGSIVNTIGDPVFVKDDNFKFVLANDALCNFLGVTREKLIGTTAMEFLPEDQMNHFLKVDRSVLESGEENLCEEIITGSDGNIKVIVTKKTRYVDDQGLRFIVGVIRDITKRKQTEEALKKNEEFLNRTGDIALVGGWEIDFNTRKVVWTRTTGTIHEVPEGYSPDLEEAFNYYHPDDQREVRQCVERAIEEGEPFDFTTRIITAKGNERWVSAIGQPVFESGKCIRLSGTFQDVTERKKAEAEVLRLSKFPSENPNPVLQISKDGEVLYGNDAATTLLTHWQYKKIGCVPEDFHQKLKGVIVGKMLAHADIEYDSKIVVLTIAPVIGVDAVNVYGLDITERRRLQAQQKEVQSRLSRAERLESLGVLAGGVAHDLNNSLGSMVMLPQVVLDSIQDLNMEPNDVTREMENCLSVINDSALRSAEVVKDLLNLSRRGQYNRKPMDLNKIMCIQSKCGCPKNIRGLQQNVTFTSSLATEPLMIMADKSHLERAVGNLVHNAAESISGNGSVDIRTSVIQADDQIMGFEIIPPGRYAVLEVEDTGTGLSKENINHMFEPFFSRKLKTERLGSGLGLAIVHGVVQDHCGFIDVVSNLNKGTTFKLYFPLLNVSAETAVVKSKQITMEKGSERILVVDDEKSQRFILSMILKKLGYDVSVATNGREAVALFAEAEKAKKDAPFDLVVLDMTMDVDFDGLDTYQAILELYPTQKVIISSGHAETGRIQAAIDLGANSLQKPYTRDDLSKAVRKRLNRG